MVAYLVGSSVKQIHGFIPYPDSFSSVEEAVAHPLWPDTVARARYAAEQYGRVIGEKTIKEGVMPASVVNGLVIPEARGIFMAFDVDESAICSACGVNIDRPHHQAIHEARQPS